MSQSDRAVQLMSQKLLQGWTMLSESCANPARRCNVPMVENRRGDKRILCVGCNTEFQREDDKFVVCSRSSIPAPVQATESKPTTIRAADSSEVNPHTLDGEDTEYDEFDWKPPTAEEARLIEARMKESQKHSAEIGQKLLQGWTMMADCCAQKECFLPLMRNPKNRELVCVAHGVPSSSPQQAAASQPLTSAIPSSALSAVASSAPSLPVLTRPPAPLTAPLTAPRTPLSQSTPQQVPIESESTPAPLKPSQQQQQQAAPQRDDIIRMRQPEVPSSKREFLDPSRPIPSEVDAVICTSNALCVQLRRACQQMDQSDQWSYRVWLMDYLDGLGFSTVQLAAQGERLHTLCSVPQNTLACVKQVMQDLNVLAALLVQKQAQASNRLCNCTDFQECNYLTLFVGRVSQWLRKVRELQVIL